MNILYLDWPCFGADSILYMWERRGYSVVKFSHEDYSQRVSDGFDEAVDCVIEAGVCDGAAAHGFDLTFSYNYFPLMARACKRHNIPYVSLVYDSPQVKLYSYTVTYPTNYIFHFDSAEVARFRKEGISNFYYMPLPVNAELTQELMKMPYDKEKFSSDLSFVGTLYNEEHNLLDRFDGISGYTRGYLNAVMDAQSKVYGAAFMEETLTPEVVQDLQSQAQYKNNSDGVETLPYIFADYFLARKLTATERARFLGSIAERFGADYDLKLYTRNVDAVIGDGKGMRNMGPASYYDEMPYIFHNSRINLNISLRSIKNGIPLRCMDIMGAGGFLLTNYQADMLEHFVPDEDFVYYESEEDMLRKIEYYLTHEEERARIAANGYEKVRENHSFELVWDQMISVVF